MLKKTLTICALAICGFVGLQAMDQETPASISIGQENQQFFANDEIEKDLTPGVLVCNGKEDKCFKNEDQEESSSSILFSIFCEDRADEENLLACKDCL